MQPVQMTGITPQPTGQPQVVYMQNGVPVTAQPMPQGQPMPMQMQPQPMGIPQQQQPMQMKPGQRTYQNATPLASLGRSPAPIDCPTCGQRSMSRIEYIVGNTTHAWALGLCCLTGLFCFVPYIMDGFKDVDHHCGQCGVLLATWHKSGGVEVHQHQ
ncbi:LITAF-like zinc ribbon domain-containing protein [Tricladium varicosporioides]|nr:LITAF-like zinc ribbon domain-containing protein [Hymenoscyphus varicosporioides]